MSPAPRLDVELALEGREEGRYRVRLGIRPAADPVELEGATLALVDLEGRPLGPAVVLPLKGEVSDPISLTARLSGPAPLPGYAALRLTAFLPGRDPLVVEQRLLRPRGLLAFVRGVAPHEAHPVPRGRALREEELALTGLLPQGEEGGESPRDEDRAAFEAFQEDLLASLEDEEVDSVTEEILRMLRED